MNRMAIDYDIFDSFHEEKEVFTEDLAFLHSFLVHGRIVPNVFSRVGFDELQEEWEKVMGGGANGVVVVSPWKDLERIVCSFYITRRGQHLCLRTKNCVCCHSASYDTISFIDYLM
jgi:hypothetical protein